MAVARPTKKLPKSLCKPHLTSVKGSFFFLFFWLPNLEESVFRFDITNYLGSGAEGFNLSFNAPLSSSKSQVNMFGIPGIFQLIL